ncbi:alpha/beta fold hydrolase [Paraliomyxa miuraensis]|uniref:alpha/beta fold hydrolase n=1 Tax=Paraliomyxa miuraensis TaxID=376150 RepID=UPI00225B3F6E|nr:alpha/beta hydrolase [Paraliomyxa miuraensis]MCX4242554.1 alpha/beta fold hydrolase [Paraliomyxa miuraensis]
MPKTRVGELDLCYEWVQEPALEGGPPNSNAGERLPVVLIMGLAAQMLLWPDGFCHGLAERGLPVLRFDNRDVGQSTWLDHLRAPSIRPQLLRWALGLPVHAPYQLEAMADDTVGLLDALGLARVHVVGASMGGMIAQLLAIRHPRRVASLTAIMSHAGDRLSGLAKPRAMQALLRPPARTREEAQDRAVQIVRAIGSPGFPLDVAAVRDRAGRCFDRGVTPLGTLRQMNAVLAGRDRRSALRSLRIPSLVVHGREDPLVPVGGGRRMAAALGAELLCIDGMGHDLPQGAWSRIVDAIDRVASAGERAR